MRTSRKNRKKNVTFDPNLLPAFVKELQTSNISYQDFLNGISMFEGVAKILHRLELRLPPIGFQSVDDAATTSSDIQNVIEDLVRLRKTCVSLLHAKPIDDNVIRLRTEKRKDIEVSEDSTFRARKTARTEARGAMDTKAKSHVTIKNRNNLFDICYVCKVRILDHDTSTASPRGIPRHEHYYPWMCFDCGDLNVKKRKASADLTAKVALVTGGRTKIGFEIVLKLLRANASMVVITTRFPADAIQRYEAQPDFSQWSARLRIYKLDLRFLGQVNSFCEEVVQKFGQLDILIQNAAQTVRRPGAYYEELIKAEERYETTKNWVTGPMSSRTCLLDVAQHASADCTQNLSIISPTTVQHSSQILVHSEDFQYAKNLSLSASTFPIGKKDSDGDQLDLRTKNSWVLDLEEVEPSEMVEVTLTNYMAPFVILQKLTPLMQRQKTNWNKDLGFIVLVSAMEGKFESCFKTGKHPHTNAAKAALNMLVRTSAKHYYNELGLVLNSVDTGWVTDEHPVEHGCRLPIPPPLDSLDGASRVLDPIFEAFKYPQQFPWHGKFFKDYKPTRW